MVREGWKKAFGVQKIQGKSQEESTIYIAYLRAR